jgi:hypothetical protein
MSSGCLSELELYQAYRQELPAEEACRALQHILGCDLCHEQWRRFALDARVAEGIRSAVIGDAWGADSAPGVADAVELPEKLHIPGFRLRGDYIDGGQARVYRAVHEASQEEVAIKVFHNSPLNEGGHARFSAELRSLARLRHPHVIPIRSAGEILGHAYYVMPWIEGQPLDEYVRQHQPSLRRRVELIAKICAAVDHAHKRGVMHLDLKPSNVRVDKAGEPVVMDFGLARLASKDGTDFVLPGLGVAGTPAYMAPEQVENREDVDTRTDVFMLGLLLHEILTGQRARAAEPQDGKRPSLDMALQRPAPVRSLAPGVGAELAAIVNMATAPRREARYQTAEALLHDLEQYLAGRPVEAMGDSLTYRLSKLTRQHLSVVVGLLAVMLILLTAVLVVREAQRYQDDAYQRAEEVKPALQRANERRMARLYLELSEAYRQLGMHQLAEDYKLQAENLFRRAGGLTGAETDAALEAMDLLDGDPPADAEPPRE